MSRIVTESSQQSQQQQSQQNAQGPSRSKLVQRLLDNSSDLPAFLKDLLTTQAVLVAGTEAAAFVVEQQGDKASLRLLHHIRPDESDQETRAQAIRAFTNIIQPCVLQRKDGAIEVGEIDNGEMQYCLVTVMRSEGDVVAASAVITRCRDMERAKQRLQSMQLVAGYFELFSLRRYTEQAKALAERHQHVLQYSSAVSTAEGFEAASMGLCNELATRTGASRVSLGWVRGSPLKGRVVKVKALSHTEKFDKKQELIVSIQKVMEECFDQEEPVRFDPEGQSTANVTRAAQELSRSQGGNSVMSVPLRRRDEIVGILTMEFPPRSQVDPGTEAGAIVAAEILAPQLYDRHENDRYIFTKIGLSIENAAKAAVGPRHMGVKLIILAVIGLLAFCVLYKPVYNVRAPFQLVAVEKRLISAPFDGQVDQVLVRPGQSVKKGDVLAKMKVTELQLERLKELEEARKKEFEADKYYNDRERKQLAEAEMAKREQAAAEARADLLQYRINQASIVAPFDAIILRGDLFDKPGLPLRQGEVLFELAQSDPENPSRTAVEMEALVSERDIQEVKRIWEAQKKGELEKRDADGRLATSSYPNDDFAFKITRIVPLGEPKDGENVFRVYADVPTPEQWMHPGLAGEARFDIEKRPFWWIWTHRLTDWLKLKMWNIPQVGV